MATGGNLYARFCIPYHGILSMDRIQYHNGQCCCTVEHQCGWLCESPNFTTDHFVRQHRQTPAFDLKVIQIHQIRIRWIFAVAILWHSSRIKTQSVGSHQNLRRWQHSFQGIIPSAVKHRFCHHRIIDQKLRIVIRLIMPIIRNCPVLTAENQAIGRIQSHRIGKTLAPVDSTCPGPVLIAGHVILESHRHIMVFLEMLGNPDFANGILDRNTSPFSKSLRYLRGIDDQKEGCVRIIRREPDRIS